MQRLHYTEEGIELQIIKKSQMSDFDKICMSDIYYLLQNIYGCTSLKNFVSRMIEI